MDREGLKGNIEAEMGQEITEDYLDHLISQALMADDVWELGNFTEDDLENILTCWYNLPHPGSSPGRPRREKITETAPAPAGRKALYENQRKARLWDKNIKSIRAEFLGQEEPLTKKKAEKWRRAHQAEEFTYRLEVIVSKDTLEKILKMEDILVASRKEETFFELGIQSGDCDLSRFKLRCQALTEKLGFPLEETMRLVLFGEVPEALAWMTISASSYGVPGMSSAGFKISGDLRETPHEVSRLYRERRRAFLEHLGERLQLYPPQERKFKTELLLSFAKETQDLTWEERLETWNERFPEYAYKTEASMRVAHSKAKGKKGGPGGHDKETR
jgi:hypothetical protein